jgi:Ca-activated chloride channel family protein
VITDGEASHEDPRDIVNQLIAESPVVLHTIGFCIGAEHSLNQPGRTVYQSADNPQELAQGLAEVLAEAPAFDVKKFK